MDEFNQIGRFQRGVSIPVGSSRRQQWTSIWTGWVHPHRRSGIGLESLRSRSHMPGPAGGAAPWGEMGKLACSRP